MQTNLNSEELIILDKIKKEERKSFYLLFILFICMFPLSPYISKGGGGGGLAATTSYGTSLLIMSPFYIIILILIYYHYIYKIYKDIKNNKKIKIRGEIIEVLYQKKQIKIKDEYGIIHKLKHNFDEFHFAVNDYVWINYLPLSKFVVRDRIIRDH